MTLAEALARLDLVSELIPVGSSNRPGTRIAPRFVTIHNTDNADRGADARAHGRYLRGADARRRRVSWHFTVDDGCVVQSLPLDELGWHAASGTGNATSLGIEICMHAGIDQAAADDRAALLAAYLARTLGLVLPDALKQHHDWSGKNCPRVIRGRPNGWRRFVATVQGHYDALDVREARTRGGIRSAPAEGVAPTAVRAAPVPAGDPVPFAESPFAMQRFWPVVTTHPQATTVSCRTAAGAALGAPGRRFLALRSNGRRQHVGIDLFAHAGDEVVACEDGTIVNFYAFYPRSTGEMTYALLVEHAGFVMNYGEVSAGSLAAYGLSTGAVVRAGQKIGRVSGTSMLHVEAFARGTRANVRWLVGSPKPRALLDPTQYLLDVADRGVRLGVDGTAVAATATASPGAVPVGTDVVAVPAGIAALPIADWHRRFEGREWRFDERGVYTRDRDEGRRPWRSRGEPETMRRIWALMGTSILACAAKHGAHPALVMMTIATETRAQREQGFTGPTTFRWEAAVNNADVTPPFTGSYSAGPMQTLATTVRDLIARRGRELGLDYVPLTVAPAFPTEPDPAPAAHPLYAYATSLDLGAAYIRTQRRHTDGDPILVAAAYNAGGIYPGAAPWGLRAHGNHLDRAAEWYGDACAVLREVGIV